MTKRIINILLLVMIVATMARAQGNGQVITDANKRGLPNLPAFDRKKIHFGFLVGLNVLDFHVYNTGVRTLENGETARYAEIQHLNPGLNLGIVTDLQLSDHFNFRVLPGVGFGQRDLTFIDENGALIGSPLKIKSTFVEVPILIKYGANRMHNLKPYVVAGATPRYDLAKDKQDHLVLKSLDCYADVGAGIDIYLTYFRLSFEIRGDWGLANVYSDKKSDDMDDIPYQQAIDKLKSRMICFTFYFE